MKTFCKALKISFSISGCFFGIGFLSGKEYFVYVYNGNFFSFLILEFIINCLGIYFLLSFNLKEISKIFDYLSPIIYFADFVALCGCLSAVDSLLTYWFPEINKLPIASSIMITSIHLVLKKGIKGLKSVSSLIVPIVIVFIILFVFLPSKKNIVTYENFSLKNAISLCGFNLLFSLPMMNNLGANKQFSTCLISAIFSSLIILIMTFLLSVSVMNLSDTSIKENFPLVKIFDNNLIFKLLYFLIICSGLFVSATNTYYPICNLLSGTKFGKWLKIVFSITAIIISRLGFSNIVSKIYPIIGFVGFSMIIIFVVELFFFQKVRPKSTLKRQVSIK